MKFLSLFAAAAALIFQSAAQGLVHELERITQSSPFTFDTTPKSDNGTVEIVLSTLDLSGSLIPAVNISIGTPPQTYLSLLDTGSADLWVGALESPLCQQPPNVTLCNPQYSGNPDYFGGIDPSKSSSLVPLQNVSDFHIGYADGTQINGSYFRDTTTFGNVQVPSTELVIATYGQSKFPIYPIWGVAMAGAEANSAKQGQYPQVIARMAQTGAIGCRMFSVWMNGISGGQYFDGGAPGTVLFGGIDHAKHTGPLQSIPMIPSAGAKGYYTIPWTGLSMGSYSDPQTQGFWKINIPAMLDTGTAAINIPSVLYDPFAAALGIQDANTNACYLAEKGVFFNFEFNGSINITVNATDIFKQGLTNGKPVTDTNGNPFCRSNVFQRTDADEAMMGQPLLQAALAVFDIDNQQIALAQAKINATDRMIEACTSTSGIPCASTATATVSVSSVTGSVTVAPVPLLNDTTVSAVAGSPTMSFLAASGTAKPTSGAGSLTGQPSIGVSMVPLAITLALVLVGGVAFTL